ncbi:MAG: MlaE family ABC transporter permease, partial [Actinomycetes bacterium]
TPAAPVARAGADGNAAGGDGHDRLVHDALMAGFDAYAGSHARAGSSSPAGPADASPATTSSTAATSEMAAADGGGSTGHQPPAAVAVADGQSAGGPGDGHSACGHDDGAGSGGPDDASRDQHGQLTAEARLAMREDTADDADIDEILGRLSGPKKHFNPLGSLTHSLANAATEVGEMSWMTALAFKSGVTEPRGYWTEVKDSMYSAIKLCWVPMLLSIIAFGLGAPGLQGGNVFTIFGVPEREGSFIIATGVREFAPWIDAMIIAGVVGTAITADIGARRIREEIDAMEVLGVDPIRELVLPRIISTALITGLFDIVAIIGGTIGGYIASVILLGASPSGYAGNFFSQANVPDLVGSFAKTFIFGAIVGIVCCYKGLRASGGPAGVGRAVNQAVVISFALIWLVNYVFTNILLGYFPATQVFR